MLKRLFSMVLAILMICSLVPFAVLAEDVETKRAEETLLMAETAQPEESTVTVSTGVDNEYVEPESESLEPVQSAVIQTEVADSQTIADPSVIASGACGDNITWTLGESGTLTISGSGSMWDDGLLGLYDRAKIQYVIIEPGVTSICAGAFQSCLNLKCVDFPEGITSIGARAFYNCNSLTSISLPEGITDIADSSFSDCDNLVSINLPNSIKTIGTQAFSYSRSLKSLYLPDGVTDIGYRAFNGCDALSELRMPSSVKRCREYAFSISNPIKDVYIEDVAAWCEIVFEGKSSNPLAQAENLYVDGVRVSKLMIPEGVTHIGAYAFLDCAPLTDVVIPASVTSIGKDVFSDIDNLYISDLVAWCRIQFSDIFLSSFKNVYLNNVLVTELVIPAEVSTISDAAFASFSNLQRVTIEEGVVQLGKNAFSYCPNLQEVTIPTSVQTIDGAAFCECNALERINIPVGVKTIGKNAFRWCNALKEISIPAGLSTIGEYAFAESGLCLVFFQGDCPQIGENAFYNVGATVSYPENNEGWPEDMRLNYGGKLGWYCESEGAGGIFGRYDNFSWELKDGLLQIHGEGYMLMEPDGVPWYPYRNVIREAVVDEGFTVMGSAAFQDCRYLTKVTLPSTLIDLSGSTFMNCVSLKEISIPQSVYIIQDSAFNGCTSLERIVIPEGVRELYGWTFKNCTSLKTVVLPKKIKKLYSSVFTGCTSLKALYFTGDMPYVSGSHPFNGWNGTVYYPAGNKTWTKEKITDWEDDVTSDVICLPYDGRNAPMLRIDIEPITGDPLLCWDAREDADWYEIWRSTSKSGKYTKVADVAGTMWQDSNAIVCKTYYYKVRAICDENSALNSDYSAVVSGRSCCAAPVAESSRDVISGKPLITWNKVDGAKKYEIYRAIDPSGKYTKLTTTTKLSLIDTKATMDDMYFYKIRAVGSSSVYNSGYSQIVDSYSICGQPQVHAKLDADSGKVILSWNKIKYALGYIVVRNIPGGEYEPLVVQTGCTFIDTDAQTDVAYEYRVVALHVNEGQYSVPSEVLTAAATYGRPAPKARTDDAGKPVIYWEAVDGAVGYRIYRSTSSSKGYLALGDTQSISYTDETADGGKTYYYKVTTLGQQSESAQSVYVKATGRCAAPKIQVKAGTTGKPVISWEKVAGAKKYEIQRSVNGSGFKKVISTSKTTYNDSKAPEGALCVYKVKALASNSRYNSDFSMEVGCYVTCATPMLTAKVDAATGKPILSWKKVSGAVGYAIYRAENGGTFILLTQTTDLAYHDDTAAVDGIYSYKAVALGSEDALHSGESKTVTVTVVCARPDVSVSISDAGKPELRWEPVEGAVAYKVYRSTRSGRSYKLLVDGVVSSTNYTDYEIGAGKSYYYKVAAISAEGNAGDYSVYKKATGKCAQPVIGVSLDNVSGKPVITWERVAGAKKYEIRYSVDGGVTWAKKTITTTKLAYTHSAAAVGTAYIYQVRALASSKSYHSVYSASAVITPACPRPKVSVKVDSVTGKPTLTWNEVEGAVEYWVYYEDGSGVYELSVTTELKVIDTQVRPGQIRSYRVCARNANELLHSDWSATEPVMAVCARPELDGIIGESGKPELTWATVEYAECYAIYRSTSSSRGYKRIDIVYNTCYTDKTAVKGRTYYYKVTALSGESESTQSSYSKMKAKK